MNDAEQRLAAQYAIRQAGKPYIWGGKGEFIWGPLGLERHQWYTRVYDCSGLVTCALRYATGIDNRASWAANDIYLLCAREEFPRLSSVACYGRSGHCTHVMLHLAEGLVIGANGGDAMVRTIDVAARRSASVDVVMYDERRDFLGWRMLPTKKE